MYDKVGDLMGLDLDDKFVEFVYGDTGYKLEFWQRNYGAGGAFGGEVGLYKRGSDEQRDFGPELEKIPGDDSAAIGGDQIEITQAIYDMWRGADYCTNAHAGADDVDHYWNSAIRTEPGVNHEGIGQRGELRMKVPGMAEAMCNAMIDAGMDATLGADRVSITFDSH